MTWALDFDTLHPLVVFAGSGSIIRIVDVEAWAMVGVITGHGAVSPFRSEAVVDSPGGLAYHTLDYPSGPTKLHSVNISGLDSTYVEFSGPSQYARRTCILARTKEAEEEFRYGSSSGEVTRLSLGQGLIIVRR